MRCARKSLSLQFPFSYIVAFAIVADMKKTEANLELLLPCRSLRPADKHPPEEEHLRRNPLLDGPRGTNTPGNARPCLERRGGTALER